MERLSYGALFLTILIGCAGGAEDELGGTADTPVAGRIAVEGAELGWRVEGSGDDRPTCLVIGSAVYYPRTFSDRLHDRLRMVYADLRHFVPDDGSLPASELTLEHYMGDIDRIRLTLDLGRTCLIGHSIHGVMALEYARRHPESVSHVVAIGSPPVGLAAMAAAGEAYWGTEASPERKAAAERIMAERADAIAAMSPEDAFIANYVASGPYYWADIDFDCAAMWDGMHINIDVSEQVFGQMFMTYDLAAGAPIRSPSLIVMGRHDYVVPHLLWDDRLNALPDHQYVLLDGSGHTPQFEQPEEFDAALLDFLAGE